MSIETATNGFGRIGSLYSRIAIDDPEIELLAINASDPGRAHDTAVRLEHDSVHRDFGEHVVDNGEDFIMVDEAKVAVYGFRDLREAAWHEVSDSLTVIESTGAFVTRESVQGHLDAGAKKVVITAPARDEVTPTIVMGVNDTPENIEAIDDVVSVSSCSTNCLAPIMKVLDNSFKEKVRWGNAKTPHAYTASQRPLDGPGTSVSKRRGVDALLPAPTGSQDEVEKLFPHFAFFNSESMRVPIADGSVAMLTVGIAGKLTQEDIIESLTEASETTHQGIINMSERVMFSGRVIGKSPSATIHPGQITINHSDGLSMVNLQAWFDNEWGYANRVADVAKLINEV